MVHLKRFDFSYGGKLSHYVTYPETLSLKTFIPEYTPPTPPSPSNDPPNTSTNMERALRNVNYKLYGVLVHLGNTSHSGHYYSYVRGPNDVWYKADDQRVSTVQLRDALAQNAYILFYNRVASSQGLGCTSEASPASLISPPPPLPQQPYLKNNIPHVIRADSTASSYLNTLNSATPTVSAAASSVPKIIIKFKKPEEATSSSPVKAVYGPQLPPFLSQQTVAPAEKPVEKVKLLDQLLMQMTDLKKIKKKLRKFNLRKLKRLKQNIDAALKTPAETGLGNCEWIN